MNLRRSSSTELVIVLAVLLCTVVAATVTLIGGPADQLTMMLDGRDVAAKEVLVKFASGYHAANSLTVQSQSDADRDTPVGRFGLRRIHSRTFDTATLLTYLNAQPDVLYAEPNYVLHSTAVPNDPSFGKLWGLQNLGQAVFGTMGVPGADIKATSAWDVTTGSTANVLAVIDTGIDYTHPDLAANVWSAPTSFTVNLNGASVTCAAGTHGINAITKVCNPMDDHNHGTHVSGTIGAVGNNGQGVAGVNWTARIMGAKFLDNLGSGWVSDAITAMDFIIQAKALTGANVRVLSNSWTGGGFSQALLDEINLTGANNMLFVVAAGNSTQNIDVTPAYPAAYSTSAPNVLAVAATDNLDGLAGFSNYGPTRVQVGAPGKNIYSTIVGGGYAYLSGTSMATPHVSGAALLVLSQCGSLDTAGLKANLIANVDPTLAGWVSSGGRINVARSITACSGSGITTRIIGVSGSLAFGTVPVGTSPTSTLTISNSGNAALSVTSITYPTGFIGSWSGSIPAGGSQPVTVTFTPTSGTTFSGTVTVNANQTSGTNTIAASGTGSCSYSISPTSASVAASAGSGSFSVTTAGSCGWTASTGTSWVHTTSSGAGSGTASYTVDANPGVARSGSITVQGNTFSITQGAAPSCSYSLSPTGTSVSSSAASGSFSVTTTAGCAWSTTPGASWVHTTSSGSGSGTVSYTVDANTASARSSIINVQGSTFSISQAALATTITPSVTTVGAGTPVTFTIANGPGNPNDWVALCNTSSPDASYIAWSFLSGSHTPPATGLTSATLQFTAPSTPGTYNLRLFANNSFTKIATSATITVTQTSPPSISLANSSVTGGSPIVFTIANGPGNPMDWVGLYSTEAGDGASIAWSYLNGTSAIPAVGITTATLQFKAPTTVGTYELRFFAGGAFTRLATSGVVTVLPPAPPSLSVSATTVSTGATFTVTVANGPANPNDWVGLYATTAADSGYLALQFLNGSTSAPSTGLSGATLTFTAPATAGTYNLRFFANGGFTKLATSATITVVLPSSPSLTVSATTVARGESFTVTVANGPGSPNDWLALAQSAASDDAYTAWRFLNGLTTPPSAGLTNATVTFTAPMTPGTYNVRLFGNNSFAKLATSPTITVP